MLPASLMINVSANPVCAGVAAVFGSTALNAGSNPAYQWKLNGNNIGGAINPSYSSFTLHNNDTIVCTLINTNTGCYNVTSDTIVMQINSTTVPTVAISTNQVIVCENSPVTFTAIAQNAGTLPVYTWKLNNTTIATGESVYSTSSLHSGDSVNCDIRSTAACAMPASASSNKIGITVKPVLQPSITISTSPPLPVCPGSSLKFYATVLNTGSNPGFQWKLNGIDTGINNDSFSASSLTNGDIIQCVLKTDSANACIFPLFTASNQITVSLKNIIIPAVTISGPTNICAGTPATFKAVPHNAGNAPVYEWKLNNGISGGNSPTYIVNGLNSGDKVYCVISSDNNCLTTPVSSNIVTVNVNNPPQINISTPDIITAYGKQAQLNATVSGPFAFFNWQPASRLTDSTSLSPFTTPLFDNVMYTLTVTDNIGCRSKKNIDVKIMNEFYMPSAFSPDGNGFNDVYRIPPAVNFILKEFIIYNRWGTVIFDSANRDIGWDGRVSGRAAVAGNYVYMIRGKLNGREITLNGNFILIR
jgi:gliding motility-associated-like protein